MDNEKFIFCLIKTWEINYMLTSWRMALKISRVVFSQTYKHQRHEKGDKKTFVGGLGDPPIEDFWILTHKLSNLEHSEEYNKAKYTLASPKGFIHKQ